MGRTGQCHSHSGACLTAARHRGWKEYPFLVGSLYSWVAKGAALVFNTGNGRQCGGKGLRSKKKKKSHRKRSQGGSETSKTLSSDKEMRQGLGRSGGNQDLTRVRVKER